MVCLRVGVKVFCFDISQNEFVIRKIDIAAFQAEVECCVSGAVHTVPLRTITRTEEIEIDLKDQTSTPFRKKDLNNRWKKNDDPTIDFAPRKEATNHVKKATRKRTKREKQRKAEWQELINQHRGIYTDSW